MTRVFAAVHLLSYPVLVWLVWVWLGIAESSAVRLIGSGVVGLFILAAVAWLLASAFEGSLKVPCLVWLRSLAFLVVCSVLFGAAQPYLLAVALFVLLPPLLMRTWRVLREWRYWAACALLALLGGYIPWKIVSWVPAAKTLAAQATSLAIRFALAYVLTIASLLAFAFVVRRLAANPTSPTPAV